MRPSSKAASAWWWSAGCRARGARQPRAFFMSRISRGGRWGSETHKEWAGQRSGPILMYNDERPRSGWAEILLFSERLAPNPSLLPKDAGDRALVFGLAHEVFGEQGLAWSRRLQLIHAGLGNKG